MLTKFASIVRTTFLETIRQPIFGVLMWVAVALLLLNPSIAAFSLDSGKDSKIMQDIGLSTMLLFGLLASVFSASSVITREIESFTVLTVISKPVSRALFLFGKFFGVALALLLAYYFLTLVFMMTVRHGVMETNADKYDMPVIVLGVGGLLISLVAATFGNYVYGWHFLTALSAWVTPLATLAIAVALFYDREWKPQSPLTDFGDLQIIYAVMLIFLAVLILAAFAVAISTRFPQVLTLILSCGIFAIGLLSDYFFGMRVEQGLLYQILYAALPNFQFFWVGDALTQSLLISGWQVLLVACYAVLYSFAVLGLGIAMFETREVG